MSALTESQVNAVNHVRLCAVKYHQAALENATHLLDQADMPIARYVNALAVIQAKTPIDVSFHPDRLCAGGENVAASLLNSGTYSNQFETGISNGGLSAFKGGNRDEWERRLFGGAYQGAEVAAKARPKYGALNLMNYWDGACPRFGSCHFRLKAAIASRCTYAYGDSSTNPDNVVVLDQFDAVLVALMKDVVSSQATLRASGLDLSAFLDRLIGEDFLFQTSGSLSAPGRSLDECIEVHIHGALNLAEDVEWLAADASFYGTECGEQLVQLSERYRFAIFWKPHLELATSLVPDDFRGSVMVPLAQRIAPDGVLNAAKIGDAVVALSESPEAWAEWGSTAQTLQYLKQIWHVLVAFGQVRQRA